MAGDEALLITCREFWLYFCRAGGAENQEKHVGLLNYRFIRSDQEPLGASLADHSGSLINN